MDLAKPGLIKQFCLPNALFSFKEYLYDFAGKETRKKGLALIEKMITQMPESKAKTKIVDELKAIDTGKRDCYF
jgi:2-iminoacetate synthase